MCLYTAYQFILLGNGFDLECGLKSRYWSFYKWRQHYLQNQQTCNRSPDNAQQDSLKRTIWDDLISLTANTRNRWVDIERSIAIWVGDGDREPLQLFIDNINENVLPHEEQFRKYIPNISKDDDALESLQRVQDALSRYLADTQSSDESQLHRVRDYLISELRKYESIFRIYILMQIADPDEFESMKLGSSDDPDNSKSGQLSDNSHLSNDTFALMRELENDPTSPKYNDQYYSKAEELLYNIARFDARNIGKYKFINSANIINFNYSVPIKQLAHKNAWTESNVLISGGLGSQRELLFGSYRNVHGNVWDDNTIFGIDEQHLESADDSVLQFTKTYRLLANYSNELAEMDHYNTDILENTRSLPINTLRKYNYYSGIDFIKIYGHSLGEADYSYFEALFDRCNLYSSKTKLIFFCEGIPKDQTNTRTDNPQYYPQPEFYMRVVHLVNEYGSTLSNQDHGNNLLHKLLLERRIEIVPAQYIEQGGSPTPW